jgi:hypothetical protein
MNGEMTMRALAWFSCGDASAVAAKMAIDRYGSDCEVLYCDTFAYEHPDNRRFFDDIQTWLGREIKVLRSPTYTDIYDVFTKTRFLVNSHRGARCTTELKKNVRTAYQRVDDIHILGFTVDEVKRVASFQRESPELLTYFPLVEAGLTKVDCHRIIRKAGIDLPMMYRLGYNNNNCIGCVKGGVGYWNKIRKDFPEVFARMAALERELGVTICKLEGHHKMKRWSKRVFLDELPPDAGDYRTDDDMECNVWCQIRARRA